MQGVQGRFFNRFSGPSAEDSKWLDFNGPSSSPPNVWGDKLFILKIQVGMGSQTPSNMMLYDRKQSFRVFMVPEDDTERFSAFLREMTRPRGGHGGLKMYRWARRTGDWEFSVCLDRAPLVDTKW